MPLGTKIGCLKINYSVLHNIYSVLLFQCIKGKMKRLSVNHSLLQPVCCIPLWVITGGAVSLSSSPDIHFSSICNKGLFFIISLCLMTNITNPYGEHDTSTCSSNCQYSTLLAASVKVKECTSETRLLLQIQ